MKKIILFLISLIGLTYTSSAQVVKDGIIILEPKEFKIMATASLNGVILDVRRPDEYLDGHIANAININWLNEDLFIKEAKKLNKSCTYYVYCRGGVRSHAAALKLRSMGFKVYDLKGGFLNWKGQKMKVVKEKKKARKKLEKRLKKVSKIK